MLVTTVGHVNNSAVTCTEYELLAICAEFFEPLPVCPLGQIISMLPPDPFGRYCFCWLFTASRQ